MAQAQKLLEEDDLKVDPISDPIESAKHEAGPRSKGKVLHCREVENAEGLSTLNGDIRVLESDPDLVAHQESEIFFSAPTVLQLRSNDLVSFQIATFEHGRPYAVDIEIIKFGGERFTAHIEVIAADIMRCSVFMDDRHLDVESQCNPLFPPKSSSNDKGTTSLHSHKGTEWRFLPNSGNMSFGCFFSD